MSMTIGERIRNRRVELGMSQEELALKCGYKHRTSIHKIETSRELPITKIAKCADALFVSPGYLLGWDETVYEEARKDSDMLKDADMQTIYTFLKDMDKTQREEIVNFVKFKYIQKGN